MKRFLNLSPQRKSISSSFKSSWTRRRTSAASCPGSCKAPWTTRGDRWKCLLMRLIVARQDAPDTSVFRPQVEENMQKVLAKERTSQSKALDLQSQLSRAKAEQSQLQRSKEEVCHQFSIGNEQLWILLFTLKPSYSDGASLPDSAAEHEGPAGAVRLQEPQFAKLRPFSENLIWKRLRRLLTADLKMCHTFIVDGSL